MMAVEWTKTERLLATGTFPQVTQLRALGLENTEERQDSGVTMMIARRLEYGEVLKTPSQEPS